MRRFFVIIAKSGSGKDSLYHYLRKLEEFLFNIFVLYYTRPMRVGEVNGETYRFVSNEEINELKKSGNVIATEYYNTNYGGCEIALVEDDQIEKEGNYLCVMSLKFFVAMKEYFKDKEDVELIPIYIDVSARERLSRSMIREEKEANPNYKEIIRRFIADEDDFKEEVLATIPACNKFVNDDFEQFVSEVVEMIRNKINTTNSTLTKNDLKKLLLVVNDGGKQAALAKSEILKEFRKNDSYEEFLFDVFSYCDGGMLLEEFPTTGKFSFDDMLEQLFSDMQGISD